jgi:hypothetical protein
VVHTHKYYKFYYEMLYGSRKTKNKRRRRRRRRRRIKINK